MTRSVDRSRPLPMGGSRRDFFRLHPAVLPDADLGAKTRPFSVAAIVETSVWTAIDSAKIELQEYETLIALNPLFLFNAMYFLWFVLFPWCLVVGSEIRARMLPGETLDIDRAHQREADAIHRYNEI